MSDTSANNKRNLDEVSFIRPILIVLLVFVHCFTVFNGGWPPFEGYKDCTGYMWFSRTCYSFMLETFIFVSGYVWAYQVIDLQKRSSLGILKKKAERLILPSVVFSLVYWQLFNGDITDLVGGGKIVISVLSGVGHLWYLPVLFWCFVSLWIVEKLKISDKVKLFILLVLALLPYPYIPFQLSRLPYYFLFFFAGFKVWQYGGLFRTNISSKKVPCILAALCRIVCCTSNAEKSCCRIVLNSTTCNKGRIKDCINNMSDRVFVTWCHSNIFNGCIVY